MPFSKEELLLLAKNPQLSPEERARAMKLLTSGPLAKPLPGKTPWEKTKAVGSEVGRGLEIGGGLIPNPMIRVPAIAAGSALTALSEGTSVPARVGTQVGLEAIFPGLSKVGRWTGLAQKLPEAGLQLGLRLGGLKGDVNRATKAFLRERGRGGWGHGVLPGTVGKVARRRKAAGAALEVAETAAPGKGKLAAVTNPALPQVRTFGASNPRKAATAAVANQKAFLRRPANVKGYGIAGNPPEVNIREMGNIKRAQQREASGLIESRLSGASPFDPVNVSETMAANRAKLLKEAQEQLAPELIPLNEQLSDLLSIQSVNKTLRGGGGLIQDVGGLGIRGGLGAGLGRSLFGAGAGGIGGLLGMTLLNPKLAAGVGFAGGRASEITPTAARLLEMWMERNKGEE